MDVCPLVKVPTHKSWKVAMKSSEQFPSSRPCSTFVLAGRKMDPISVVKFELWAAKSEIFLSLILFAFGNFEK